MSMIGRPESFAVVTSADSSSSISRLAALGTAFVALRPSRPAAEREKRFLDLWSR